MSLERDIKRKKKKAPECIKCGRCCSHVRVGLKAEGDLKEFLNAYFGSDPGMINFHFDRRCAHLTRDNLCDIHETKPKMCREHECKGHPDRQVIGIY